ncbi:MAG: GxxExxY protein [Gemmatimonadaceae bacterium]
MAMLHSELTDQALGGFYAVYKELGFGFLEPVYGKAMVVELQFRGLEVAQEVASEVVYRGVEVGRYRSDIVVEGRLLIEVKSTKTITEADERQLLNYLKTSKIEVGLLLHFGPKPAFRRLIYTNDRK